MNNKLPIKKTLAQGFDLTKKTNKGLLISVVISFLALDLWRSMSKFNTQTVYMVSVPLILTYLYVYQKSALQNLKPKEVLKTFSLMKVLTTQLFEDLLLTILFILLIVPGVIFCIYWLFATFIAIDQNIGYLKALSASKKLVAGNWWRVFLLNVIAISFLICVLVLVYFVPNELAQIVLVSLVGSLGMFFLFNVAIAAYMFLKPEPQV